MSKSTSYTIQVYTTSDGRMYYNTSPTATSTTNYGWQEVQPAWPLPKPKPKPPAPSAEKPTWRPADRRGYKFGGWEPDEVDFTFYPAWVKSWKQHWSMDVDAWYKVVERLADRYRSDSLAGKPAGDLTGYNEFLNKCDKLREAHGLEGRGVSPADWRNLAYRLEREYKDLDAAEAVIHLFLG